MGVRLGYLRLDWGDRERVDEWEVTREPVVESRREEGREGRMECGEWLRTANLVGFVSGAGEGRVCESRGATVMVFEAAMTTIAT